MEHKKIQSVRCELSKLTQFVPEGDLLIEILKEIGIEKELARSRVTKYVFRCHVLCPDQIAD